MQVSVDGRKQGSVKKNYGTYKARVAICRKEIAKEVIELRKVLDIGGNCLPDTYQ